MLHVMCHLSRHVSRVTCHVLRVTCHVSRFMCHMSFILFFNVFFGQSGEVYRWRVCYQRGLPHLVLTYTVVFAQIQC